MKLIYEKCDDIDIKLQKLRKIMNDRKIAAEFVDPISYVKAASIDNIWFVMKEKETIGFFGFTKLGYSEDYLFLDIGIIEKYRHQGIGKEVREYAVNLFRSNQIEKKLLARVNVSNQDGLNSIMNSAHELTEINGYNFYLIKDNCTKEEIEKEKKLVLVNPNFTCKNKKDFFKNTY